MGVPKISIKLVPCSSLAFDRFLGEQYGSFVSSLSDPSFLFDSTG
jgi:hypothetical protein